MNRRAIQHCAPAATDNQHFIPMLPPAALRDVVVAALRLEIAPPAISQLLRRQMPDQAMELLRGLQDAPEPPVRANVARLLGELGASAAYPSQRASAPGRRRCAKPAGLPTALHAASPLAGRIRHLARRSRGARPRLAQ